MHRFFITLTTLLAFTLPAYADCPDLKPRCWDGTEVTINQKWEVFKGCQVCTSGCGHTPESAKAACINGGHGELVLSTIVETNLKSFFGSLSECPAILATCNNGDGVTLDAVYVAGSGCVPCQSGCTNSLDRAINYCNQGTRGGLNAKSAQGLSVKYVLDRIVSGNKPAPVTQHIVSNVDEVSDPDTRQLDQMAFLMAHNAFATAQGATGRWVYSQHGPGFYDLMANSGVRGGEIDVYWFNVNSSDRRLALCHEKDGNKSHNCPLSTTVLRQGPPPEINTFFEEVRRYIAANKQAIIIIKTESYVGTHYKNDQPVNMAAAARDAWDKELKRAGVASFIFTPQDYLNQGNKWPTISWMRQNNKRIVILSTEGDTNLYAFPVSQFLRENHWDWNETSCGPLRGFSQTAPMFAMNHFKEFSLAIAGAFTEKFDYKVLNSFDKIKTRLESCKTNQGFLPNMVMIDNANIGDGQKVVLWLNSQPASAFTPK